MYNHNLNIQKILPVENGRDDAPEATVYLNNSLLFFLDVACTRMGGRLE